MNERVQVNIKFPPGLHKLATVYNTHIHAPPCTSNFRGDLRKPGAAKKCVKLVQSSHSVLLPWIKEHGYVSFSRSILMRVSVWMYSIPEEKKKRRREGDWNMNSRSASKTSKTAKKTTMCLFTYVDSTCTCSAWGRWGGGVWRLGNTLNTKNTPQRCHQNKQKKKRQKPAWAQSHASCSQISSKCYIIKFNPNWYCHFKTG